MSVGSLSAGARKGQGLAGEAGICENAGNEKANARMDCSAEAWDSARAANGDGAIFPSPVPLQAMTICEPPPVANSWQEIGAQASTLLLLLVAVAFAFKVRNQH